MTAPRCPYCEVALKKMPTRKTKCKTCGQVIYIKSTPCNRTKRLMTEAQANDADRQWHERHQADKTSRHVQVYGVPPPRNRGEQLALGRAVAQKELERARRVGKTAEICVGRDGCAECKELEGQIWSIDDALRRMPIPLANCIRFQRGAACCCFWAMPKREEP